MKSLVKVASSVRVPGVDPLLEVVLFGGVQLAGAARHDVGVAGDGVSHVEVVHSVGQQGIV